jgi:hypothetical protein
VLGSCGLKAQVKTSQAVVGMSPEAWAIWVGLCLFISSQGYRGKVANLV